MIVFESAYKGIAVKLECPKCYEQMIAYSDATMDLPVDPPDYAIRKNFLGWVVKCPRCQKDFLAMRYQIKEA